MTIAAQGFIAMIAVGLAIGFIAGIKSSGTPVKVSYLIAGVAGSVAGSLLFPDLIGGHISDLVISNSVNGRERGRKRNRPGIAQVPRAEAQQPAAAQDRGRKRVAPGHQFIERDRLAALIAPAGRVGRGEQADVVGVLAGRCARSSRRSTSRMPASSPPPGCARARSPCRSACRHTVT